MVDGDLTWILPDGYCLVSGESKENTHYFVEALVICFSLLYHLLPMSTQSMARREWTNLVIENNFSQIFQVPGNPFFRQVGHLNQGP